ACADSSVRFTRLYDVMIDELYLVLARSAPYDKKDFEGAALNSLRSRAPSLETLEHARPKPYLLSSGMDALSSGYVAAKKAHPGSGAELLDGSVENANYFEAAEILKHSKTVQDTGDVIVATLNPSTPLGTDPTVTPLAKIIEAVNKKLEGVTLPGSITLVVDVTIETKADKSGGGGGETELNELIRQLKAPLDDGRLDLVLCKSYQKYPSLGTGKVMAGSLTVISRDDRFAAGKEHLERSEEQLGYMGNDESQLMTHLLKNAAGSELDLVDRASRNATFFKNVCAGGGDGFGLSTEGLPFALVNDMASAHLLFNLGLEQRDSFGFQNSSCLGIPTGTRINFGQESEPELLEKFYAYGKILTPRFPEPNPGSIDTLVKENSTAAATKAKALLDAKLKTAGGELKKTLEALRTELDDPDDTVRIQASNKALALVEKGDLENGSVQKVLAFLDARVKTATKTSDHETLNRL
ncbi:MAG: hypothetical protein LC745_12360, partial [Planctomycetia bacterium]|nr:hypothetical protein [Planctomycetia bacterium]